MKSIADVVEPDTPKCIPLGFVTYRALPARTPGQALGKALGDYPGVRLWCELRQMLPTDGAARVYEAAAAAYRESRS